MICVCSVVGVAACGGAPDVARRNQTFYFDPRQMASGGAALAAQLEKPFPPLNLAEGQGYPRYDGKLVLRDGVRLSRPAEWMIREASVEAGHAFIQYISPKGYAFALYERPDPPLVVWREVLSHYEDDVGTEGATIIGKHVPTAVFRGQGRAYSIQRSVEEAKRPLISNSREILVRGEHRVILVQVIHEGTDMSGVDGELMRVFTTLEVL